MLAAMMTPHGPSSLGSKPYSYGYGYGLELVVQNGQVTIFGHGGADPGVSAAVAHHRPAATTIARLPQMVGMREGEIGMLTWAFAPRP